MREEGNEGGREGGSAGGREEGSEGMKWERMKMFVPATE